MAFEIAEDNEVKQIDRWLFSRVQSKIQEARDYMSQMQTRSAFQSGYHEMMQEIKWYLKRRGSRGPAYTYAVKTMVLLVAPFVPHVVEEIWEKWGEDGFSTNASYPEVDETKIYQEAEYAEKFLGSFIDDIRGLRNFLKERENPDPEVIEVYVSEEWKYDIYNMAFEEGLNNLIGKVMKNPEMKKLGKPAVNYTQGMMKDGAPPDFPWDYQSEWDALEEAHSYLEEQVDAPIKILNASESDHPKSKQAVPRRPGINFVISE